ncbi:uncharacterized protein [Musca autumnalis]|uniref:uncharacterized protein n=1 Tax=Musca autumnalis TaxID=221902 RepID=UPI003CF65386
MRNCKFYMLIKFHRNVLKIVTIYLALLCLREADGRPEDFFESMAVGAVQMAGQAAQIMANGAALGSDKAFEVPFAKVRSKQEAGFGEAIQKYDDSDSSEEYRRRRKRSISLSNEMALESLYELEALMPLPHHHRSKRAPCFSWGGGTGGSNGGGGAGNGGAGGAGGDGDGIDGDDALDVERRRRRQMAARRRKAAQQRKKSRTTAKKQTTRKTNKRTFVGDEALVSTDGARRKRQTEVEDLTDNMNKSGKDFSQYAQQFAETVRSAWENFANSVNQLAQRVKQAIKGGNNNNGSGGETGEI